MSQTTGVCDDCPKRSSGYLPYYGLTCDGCIKCVSDENKE